MQFETFWIAIEARNHWDEETRLSVPVEVVKRLAAQAYEMGLRHGVDQQSFEKVLGDSFGM